MDNTMNLAMTFQMSLDCFLKEKKKIPKQMGYEEALKILETIPQYRSMEKKVMIAKEALSLCPDCIEAYYAYGCYTQDSFLKMQILKQAMEKATLFLGKDFFLKDCVDFYIFEEAHIYFEIKFAYALTLFENGYMKKAKQQLKEIINLHPSDHYRAHEFLYIVYLHLEEDSACKELLNTYKDRNTLYVYIVFLLTMKQCRFKEAKQMIPLLKESNIYLFEMLCHTRLHMAIPTFLYTGGSEEEASYIYQLISRLLITQEAITQFLNTN